MTLATTLRALSIAALTLAGPAAVAQETGSMEVRLGGEDRAFVVLSPAEGTQIEGENGAYRVVLAAAPDDLDALGPVDAPEDGPVPRLTVSFAAEGMGSDVAVRDPRIVYADGEGRDLAAAEGMTATVSVGSLTQIGETFVVTGDFSSELAPEGGGEAVGVSGSFQATIEGG